MTKTSDIKEDQEDIIFLLQNDIPGIFFVTF